GLRRWIEMCLEEGVKFFEMSHLFTQWGCTAAPKIVATVNGKKQRIFGWDTPSDSPEYASFLRKFLPALKKELVELKVYDRTFFHISDEPRKDNRENYKKANALVRSILPDAVFLDALSDHEFYKEGLIDVPACGTNKITPFLEGDVKTLWAYYCCTQTTKSSNRFIAMPSSRNRVLGQQLFKYDIKGFLHWGYNFYNCMYSYHHIDPYRTVDAEGGVPGGDPFLVYPGKGGRPDESIRLMVLSEAFNDFRALKLLASLSSFEEAVSFLDEGLTFSDYPMEGDYCISLRERVNRRIGELV
ncbi:MAG: DUF4091 domain-containing protein, partial [Lachnospiraceae bacterium]|nr:DUF4091 domain-containing protein [Lachnospiraceae bacterium]